jgi:hypothetical protein
MRQRGQRPAVAAEGSAAPHLGQRFDEALEEENVSLITAVWILVVEYQLVTRIAFRNLRG